MICNQFQLIVFSCLLFAITVTFAVPTCEKGEYLHINGGCVSCDIGYMCIDNNQTKCVAGTYQSMGGKSFCNDCPENNFCNTSVGYQMCPTGYISKPRSSSCTQCASEYYIKDGKCTPKQICNQLTHYQSAFGGNSTDRICQRQTECNSTQYVKQMPTSTTDRKCATKVECQYNEYKSQEQILNNALVETQEQKCSQYTDCTNKIKTFDGLKDGQGKQDHKCVEVITCTSSEYMISSFNISAGRQTVCEAKKICNTFTEYIYRLGNTTHNTECRPNRICLSYQYINTSSKDSTRYDVIGTDVQCNNITKCGAGYATLITAGSNVQCLACPMGSFSLSGQQCEVCGKDSYANTEKSSQCKPCNLLSSLNTSFGYSILCSSTHDSNIIPCPVSWRLDSTTSMCTQCADGYLKNISSADTCYICPNNSYCPSMSLELECPNKKIFDRGNNFYATVPSSPHGSLYASDCDCSQAGGFEGLFLIFVCYLRFWYVI